MLDHEKVYYANDQSVARQMRLKRLQIFLDLLERVPKPCRILDVGGEPEYWEKLGFDVPQVEILCVNLHPKPSQVPFIQTGFGDATNLSEYGDQSFDIVYSNSVIEHLFTLENQAKMAREVARVGQRYWVQTPNRYFPIEPHFLFPMWQFLPMGLRMHLLKKRRVGFLGPCADDASAYETAAEIRLMSRGEFHGLFPGSTLLVERWKGLAKSFVVHKGFD